MKPSILVLGAVALMGLGPVRAAIAAGPPPTLVPLNFAIAPGCQFAPGCQPHPKTPQVSFTYTLAPGQTIHDYIAVLNPSKTSPIAIKLSVADGVTPAQGAGIGYNSTAPREIGRWFHPGSATTTAVPGRITLVPLTISIPRSVRPGEYMGAVVGTSVSAATVTAGKLHYLVHGSKRCMVLLRVTGHATAGLQIVGAGVMATPKSAAFALSLRNTGTVIDHPSAVLLTFVGAHNSYSFHPPIGVITAGDTTTLGWAVGGVLPKGTYKVSVHITYLAQIAAGAPYQQLQAGWNGSAAVP